MSLLFMAPWGYFPFILLRFMQKKPNISKRVQLMENQIRTKVDSSKSEIGVLEIGIFGPENFNTRIYQSTNIQTMITL
jgi:hypothetical protein